MDSQDTAQPMTEDNTDNNDARILGDYPVRHICDVSELKVGWSMSSADMAIDHIQTP